MPKVYLAQSRELAEETVYFISSRDGADELVYVVDSPELADKTVYDIGSREVADKTVYGVTSPELASPLRRTKVFLAPSYSPFPHYVVEDEGGDLFEFVGLSGGWALRGPYLGSKTSLTELPDREASSVMQSFGIPRKGHFRRRTDGR